MNPTEIAALRDELSTIRLYLDTVETVLNEAGAGGHLNEEQVRRMQLALENAVSACADFAEKAMETPAPKAKPRKKKG